MAAAAHDERVPLRRDLVAGVQEEHVAEEAVVPLLRRRHRAAGRRPRRRAALDVGHHDRGGLAADGRALQREGGVQVAAGPPRTL